jgi:hypothetical protein
VSDVVVPYKTEIRAIMASLSINWLNERQWKDIENILTQVYEDGYEDGRYDPTSNKIENFKEVKSED